MNFACSDAARGAFDADEGDGAEHPAAPHRVAAEREELAHHDVDVVDRRGLDHPDAFPEHLLPNEKEKRERER